MAKGVFDNSIVSFLPKPAYGTYLDELCSIYAVDRHVSIDWQKGFIFNPHFSMRGKLLSIYSESDALFRTRVTAHVMNKKEQA